MSSGEAGSARHGEKDTTNADVTAVARPAGEARPLGSTPTASDIAVSSGEARPFSGPEQVAGTAPDCSSRDAC